MSVKRTFSSDCLLHKIEASLASAQQSLAIARDSTSDDASVWSDYGLQTLNRVASAAAEAASCAAALVGDILVAEDLETEK